MSQQFTISNAIPAKDKAGNNKSWSSEQYGTFYVFKYYFIDDDQPYYVNRKSLEGAPVKGEIVYGTVGEDKYGNKTFKQEQNPNGSPAPRQQSQPSGNLEAKVDYIISLLENFLESQNGAARAQTSGDTAPKDIDDGPVDLSQLEY
jgi:hypothetical protein